MHSDALTTPTYLSMLSRSRIAYLDYDSGCLLVGGDGWTKWPFKGDDDSRVN